MEIGIRTKAAALLLCATAAAAGQTPTGFQAEVAHRLDTHLGKQMVQLAAAIPEDSWGWRPSEQVRSVGEVVRHLAGANYWFGVQMGAERPDDLPSWAELDGKTELLEALERSFRFVRQAVLGLSDRRLDERIEFYGQEITLRELTLNMMTHGSEHMGQLIAYARSIGVVPPWSAEG